MSMDSTGFTGNGARTTDNDPVTDAPMMAATPIWETRGKKRKGASRSAVSSAASAPATVASTVAPEPRSFDTRPGAPVTTPLAREPEPSFASTATMTDPMTGRPDLVETSDSGLISPIGRTRTTASTKPARKGGVPAAAIAAGVVALGAVGAAGWFASQQNEGVAELTPGSATVAQAPAAPAALPTTDAAPAPMNMAAAPPALASTPAAPAAGERRAEPVRTAARSRPAAAAQAPSADQAGINASGTAELPSGPQPYSAVNPAPNPTQGPAPAATDGAAVAPAPAPIPSTPPVLSVPAPAASPAAPVEAAPTVATPPQ